jgi:hypothetical protein
VGAIDGVLPGAVARGVLWQACPGRFLLDVPGAARYLVEEGRRVTVDPSGAAPSEAIARFFCLAPLAALHYQQGRCAAHAAAAAKGGRAVVIAGDSGAGKSTLGAGLLARGWRMIADEVTVIDLDDSSAPGMPGPMVWRGHDSAPGDEANWPVHRVYWLSVHNKGAVEVEDVAGALRFRMAGLLAYNTHIADVLLDRAAQFRLTAGLAGRIPIRLLRRPRAVSSIADLIRTIERDWL